ncbi:hypothetical protein [Parasitella parasitica]|uniref:Uncharacterized protein n=1 Tax=Parasitella parasitica TaxID=35722 RepID=A0A0B7N5C3_9FUNG|nr:hypothetical protein [Parasitella parasitica]
MANGSSANTTIRNSGGQGGQGLQGRPGSNGSFQDPPLEGEVGANAQFPPNLSDVRGFTVPMSDIEQGSHNDGESVRDMFLKAKAEYEGLVSYFSGQRKALIDGMCYIKIIS